MVCRCKYYAGINKIIEILHNWPRIGLQYYCIIGRVYLFAFCLIVECIFRPLNSFPHLTCTGCGSNFVATTSDKRCEDADIIRCALTATSSQLLVSFLCIALGDVLSAASREGGSTRKYCLLFKKKYICKILISFARVQSSLLIVGASSCCTCSYLMRT